MSRDTPPRPSANRPRTALINGAQTFSRAIVDVRHVSLEVISREILGQNVSGVDLAWNVAELNDAEAHELLQQPHTPRDVRKSL